MQNAALRTSIGCEMCQIAFSKSTERVKNKNKTKNYSSDGSDSSDGSENNHTTSPQKSCNISKKIFFFFVSIYERAI